MGMDFLSGGNFRISIRDALKITEDHQSNMRLFCELKYT